MTGYSAWPANAPRHRLRSKLPNTIDNRLAAPDADMAASAAREGEARREDAAADEALLERYQRAAFGYFLRNRNPANGLYADNSRDWSPISIAVVGFALSAYPVAVERGWNARGGAVRSEGQTSEHPS